MTLSRCFSSILRTITGSCLGVRQLLFYWRWLLLLDFRLVSYSNQMKESREIRIGLPVSGIVTKITKKRHNEYYSYELKVKIDREITGTLKYTSLVDDSTTFEQQLPTIGNRVETVVCNHIDQDLYLTTAPSSLSPETIQKYRDFYIYKDQTSLGTIINGTVSSIQPFGVFVNIKEVPFSALIEIVLSKYYPGKPLPYHQSDWPQKGERIRCRVNYFREHNTEIGLGWLPE